MQVAVARVDVDRRELDLRIVARGKPAHASNRPGKKERKAKQAAKEKKHGKAKGKKGKRGR